LCIVCNAIGYNHNYLNGPGSSLAFNDPLSSWGTSSSNAKNEDSFNSQESPSLFKDATSSSTTLNFNEGDNIIIPSENGVTYRGLGGNDAYIISTNTTEPNSKIEIVDTSGDNIIQLINGLVISKSLFTSDAIRLTLSDGSTVTINGADKFSFELSGNLTNGSLGDKKTFSEFAKYMGLEALPLSGSDEGNKNITIQSNLDNEEAQKEEADTTTSTSKSRVLQKDLSNLPLKNFDKIQSNQKIEINLKDFFSVPKVSPTGSTDLSLLSNLEDTNVIILEKTDTYATLSLKENIEGMEVLDLNFLNIDEGSLEISQHYYNAYYRVIEDPPDQGYNYYWRDADKSYNFFELKDNILSLYAGNYIKETDMPNSYAEYTEAQFYYTYIDAKTGAVEKPGEKNNNWYPTENFKVKLSYTSEGIEKEYIVSLDSVFNAADEISTYKDKINSIPSYSSIEFEIQDNSHPFFTRDQILLDGSKLSLKGGVDNGEVFSVYIKVRASAINSDGFEYTNPKDGYKDLELTIMMTDDDYIKTQSSKILESKDSETSISIIEDNPGDILLDLSDFNIDPGTAKIKNVTINHLEDYKLFEPNISKTFYIDDNVLKFTEGTLYDYDSDNLSWINHIKNGTDANYNQYGYAWMENGFTSDVRDNDFEITFIYKSNNEEFEHIVKIVEYENTTYGSAFSSDYILTYSNEITNNVFINALNTDKRLPHLKSEKESYLMKETEWSNYETTITYSFLDPNKEEFHALGGLGDNRYFTPYNDKDTAHSYNDIGKNMIRGILEKTSEIFKITFEEVDTDIAQIKFSLYTTTSKNGASNYANYPSNIPGDHVLVGDESTFKDASWVSINPNGRIYSVAVHELGHNLGLSHPFSGFSIGTEYADSYYANELFTVMSYAAFWSKDFNIYELEPESGKYSSYVESISGITKKTYFGSEDKYAIAQENWGRDDILTLGYMYGLRDNYNNNDSIYIFHEEENIFTTIHDMGGYDTIDLSNYSWNMEIDLNPGGVSEVGTNQERLHWNSSEGEKTGDVFILSWETVIEKYTGSSGSNLVTLNNKISNTVDLSISKNTNTIKKAIPTDVIFGSPNDDYVHVTISNLEEINESISIDGAADFDWLVIEAPVKLNSLENIDNIEVSKNNDKALVALKENIKGMEVLDLNFLNIDEGSLKISEYYYNAYGRVIEDPPIPGYDYYWWDTDTNFILFELKDNILSLYGDNYINETGLSIDYLEYTEAQIYFKYTNDKGEINQGWYPTENFKVKLSYTSEGIEKEYIVEIDSIYNNDSPYSDYFDPEEDLNLDFNLTDLLTHFDNIENFDFTNNEKNTITITEDTFQLSNKTKIKGDENDEISLPQGAEQTSYDDLYLYYSLNEVEIAISVDLLLI